MSLDYHHLSRNDHLNVFLSEKDKIPRLFRRVVLSIVNEINGLDDKNKKNAAVGKAPDGNSYILSISRGTLNYKRRVFLTDGEVEYIREQCGIH